MTGGTTTIGEMSVADLIAMVDRVKATIERHGYDHHNITEYISGRGVSLSIRAIDGFNGRNEFSKGDVEQLKVDEGFLFALADDSETAERDLHAFIQRQPNRISRERAHMAWVLNQQMERLGNYSGEARDAFVTAFRRSMDEAGLLALTQAPSEG
ncbi:MAG: hypothetical protein ACMVO3_22915 [Thalassobaculum sp.]